MSKRLTVLKPRAAHGFSLVELTITTAVMAIVGLAIGVVIVDGQTGWNTMYGRINSDIVSDGYVARRKFDSVMRGASNEQISLAEDGSWVEVCSYSSSDATSVDCYWRLYVLDGDLNAEYGQLDPRSTLNTDTVCENVSSCTFQQFGKAIQMTLVLDNGTQSKTIVSSAVAHNE